MLFANSAMSKVKTTSKQKISEFLLTDVSKTYKTNHDNFGAFEFFFHWTFLLQSYILTILGKTISNKWLDESHKFRFLGGYTSQKMEFSMKDFFRKCDRIR